MDIVAVALKANSENTIVVFAKDNAPRFIQQRRRREHGFANPPLPGHRPVDERQHSAAHWRQRFLAAVVLRERRLELRQLWRSSSELNELLVLRSIASQ